MTNEQIKQIETKLLQKGANPEFFKNAIYREKLIDFITKTVRSLHYPSDIISDDEFVQCFDMDIIIGENGSVIMKCVERGPEYYHTAGQQTRRYCSCSIDDQGKFIIRDTSHVLTSNGYYDNPANKPIICASQYEYIYEQTGIENERNCRRIDIECRDMGDASRKFREVSLEFGASTMKIERRSDMGTAAVYMESPAGFRGGYLAKLYGEHIEKLELEHTPLEPFSLFFDIERRKEYSNNFKNFLETNPQYEFNPYKITEEEREQYFDWVNAEIEQTPNPVIREALKEQAKNCSDLKKRQY